MSNSNTNRGLRSVDGLIRAVQAHVARYPLSPPAWAGLDVRNGRATIEPGGTHALDVVDNVLLWSTTLQGVTAQLERTSADRLRISITGRGCNGLPVTVAGQLHWDECAGRFGVLDPGATDSISLDELFDVRTQLADQIEREAI
jgi:hypothetical protein